MLYNVGDASQSVLIILLRLQSSLESLFLGDSFAGSKYPQSPVGFLTRHALAVEAYTVYKQGDRRKVPHQTHTQSRKGTAAKCSKNPQSALLHCKPTGTLNVPHVTTSIYPITGTGANLMIIPRSSPISSLVPWYNPPNGPSNWSRPKLAIWIQYCACQSSIHGNPKPTTGFPTTTPPMEEVSVHRNHYSLIVPAESCSLPCQLEVHPGH